MYNITIPGVTLKKYYLDCLEIFPTQNKLSGSEKRTLNLQLKTRIVESEHGEKRGVKKSIRLGKEKQGKV